MQGYFPYSYIIGLCETIKQTVSRHAFFGDWYVSDKESETGSSTRLQTISELYY